MKNVLIALTLVLISSNCQIVEKKNREKQNDRKINLVSNGLEISYNELFRYRELSNPVVGDSINDLKNLSKDQIQSWLLPYLNNALGYDVVLDPTYFKAVSIQKQSDTFSTFLLLMNVEDGNEQFLVSVGPNGGYIDGLKVFSNWNSGEEFDSTRNIIKGAIQLNSRFNSDSVFVKKEQWIFDMNSEINLLEKVGDAVYIYGDDGSFVKL